MGSQKSIILKYKNLKMHMTYYFGFIKEPVVVSWWNVETTGQTVGTCFMGVALVLILYLIKYIRAQYLSPKLTSKSYFAGVFNCKHVCNSLLFGLQMFISYTLMLACMLYNMWLILSICLGFVLAQLLLVEEGSSGASGKVNEAMSEEDCC